MCRTKRLNPFFRLHEASEVLNKYVTRVWQARRQGFGKGDKNHKGGDIIKIQCWMYAASQQPGVKHEMGVRAPLDPHWRRPWGVVRFTTAFFVSFIVTVFVPDCAAAVQICSPKMLSGFPNGDL